MGGWLGWKLQEGCSLTYLQENNFQLSRVVNCSEPPECCQRKMQSCFNGQLRKLKKESEVRLGSCWEIETLSKKKRPSWTSRIPSEKAFSSLCSTIFTSDLFVAFDGRHLSNSSIAEVLVIVVRECYLTKKLSMKFHCSLKVIKGNKKNKFSKKQRILHKQTIEIKQVKQMATLRYNYSSSQTAEFHPSLRVSRDHSTLQP